MRKAYAKIVLVIAIMIVAIWYCYLGGYRFTPLEAAHFDIGENSVPFGNVDFGWGKVILFNTPNGPRTVLAIRSGFLWRAPDVCTLDKLSSDKINTVGWMSYNSSKNQATVLAVQSSDPNVAFIEMGSASEQEKKAVKTGTPIIFSWNKLIQFYDLKPTALSKDGAPLYEYRYPKNTNVISSNDLKWYPVNGDK